MNRRNIWIAVAAVLAVCAVLLLLYVLAGCGSARRVAKGPEAETGKADAVAEAVAGAGAETVAVRPAISQPWLELPGAGGVTGDDLYIQTHWAQMQGRSQRNYSYVYDDDVFASYWVAYPLCAAHLTTGREEVWGYDPKVPKEEQTSVSKGYGASVPTRNYPSNFYARGHQLPNADRNAVPQMQAQTYYSTNMTPQIQNGFNGGIWAKLEEAVRDCVPQDDTLYVVTGAAFRKVGAEEAVDTVLNKNDGKSLPVPNYYWKAVLKVKREQGQPVSAITIGFWLPHEDLKGYVYDSFAVSVDELEEWTGFDLFVNVPDSLEPSAEANDDWAVFRSF